MLIWPVFSGGAQLLIVIARLMVFFAGQSRQNYAIVPRLNTCGTSGLKARAIAPWFAGYLGGLCKLRTHLNLF